MGISKPKLVSLMWTIIFSVVLALGAYVAGVGDIFKIDSHAVVNVIVLTAFSTVVASIKLLGVNEDTGKLLGTQIR